MNKQSGLALSTLIVWGIGIALLALIGMKVVPSVLEYQGVLKTVKTIVNEASPAATVADIRAAFSRYDDVNDYPSVDAKDLEITKDAGQLVVSFAYEKRIPLFANVSLVIDFSGSSN
ncbi:MAG: DUF4845 domain-containing protein [Azovibrio sp.]|uniref:DUF4845 domain-containing protein n=1 Tax=Azovibrio sp. TaxID=1872673 RepID=UPI003C718ADD